MEYKNSSGYFADPYTEQPLSVDMERCVPCTFDNGKFTWPMVLLSNGDPVKIVYKLFTEEEKALYKAYRGRDTGVSKPRVKKEKPVKLTSNVVHVEPDIVVRYNEEGKQTNAASFNSSGKVTFDNEAAVSVGTLAVLAAADYIIGVSQIGGVTYALVGSHSNNRVHHIPRAVIPDAEFERLCCGS